MKGPPPKQQQQHRQDPRGPPSSISILQNPINHSCKRKRRREALLLLLLLSDIIPSLCAACAPEAMASLVGLHTHIPPTAKERDDVPLQGRVPREREKKRKRPWKKVRRYSPAVLSFSQVCVVRVQGGGVDRRIQCRLYM